MARVLGRVQPIAVWDVDRTIKLDDWIQYVIPHAWLLKAWFEMAVTEFFSLCRTNCYQCHKKRGSKGEDIVREYVRRLIEESLRV